MRIRTLIFCVCLMNLASLSAGSDVAPGQDAVVPKFVVCASTDNAEFGSSLFRVLRSHEKVSRFDKAETIEGAITSDAEVLVRVLPTRLTTTFPQATIDELKKRKIVGIGYGAAQLFGQLGLEINDGACAHLNTTWPKLTIGESELLGTRKAERALSVLREGTRFAKGDVELVAVFQPVHHENSAVVDVLARAENNANYAPIVRQGNCVLMGVAIPATRWTESYADLVRTICHQLHDRNLEQFATARRDLTQPGEHPFTLAKRGSTDVPFTKIYYFQYTKPTRFHAQLDHVGSDSVMLIFTGQDEFRTHFKRQDAFQQEQLNFEADLTLEEMGKLEGRYWELRVTNFGNDPVNCKLTITTKDL